MTAPLRKRLRQDRREGLRRAADDRREMAVDEDRMPRRERRELAAYIRRQREAATRHRDRMASTVRRRNGRRGIPTPPEKIEFFMQRYPWAQRLTD